MLKFENVAVKFVDYKIRVQGLLSGIEGINNTIKEQPVTRGKNMRYNW